MRHRLMPKSSHRRPQVIFKLVAPFRKVHESFRQGIVSVEVIRPDAARCLIGECESTTWIPNAFRNAHETKIRKWRVWVASLSTFENGARIFDLRLSEQRVGQQGSQLDGFGVMDYSFAKDCLGLHWPCRMDQPASPQDPCPRIGGAPSRVACCHRYRSLSITARPKAIDSPLNHSPEAWKQHTIPSSS
jgi:hypothetical protein